MVDEFLALREFHPTCGLAPYNPMLKNLRTSHESINRSALVLDYESTQSKLCDSSTVVALLMLVNSQSRITIAQDQDVQSNIDRADVVIVRIR